MPRFTLSPSLLSGEEIPHYKQSRQAATLLAAAKGSSRDPRVKKAVAGGHCGCFFVRHCRTLAFSSIAVETTELVRL
jgi:hypothetical protein